MSTEKLHKGDITMVDESFEGMFAGDSVELLERRGSEWYVYSNQSWLYGWVDEKYLSKAY